MSLSLFISSRMRHSVNAISMLALIGFATIASAQHYVQTNLVSDIPHLAAKTDPNLVNAWGIAFTPGSPAWVADNGTGLSTLYSGSTIAPLVVTIAPPKGEDGPATPTGIVFNGGGAFNVTAHDKTGSSLFMFATEDGTISGWSPSVDGTHSILGVDNHDAGAVYKGLAIGTVDQHAFIYATNFNSGWVEMYDSSFGWVKNFTDTTLPLGYAPFGIRNINNLLFVTFALQDSDKHDDVAGHGHGFVDVFDLNGNKVKRLISQGELNSPWGLAWAPARFGELSGDLLVGNFGNGHVNAYNIQTGAFISSMRRPSGTVLEIPGLWALAFGNGGAAGPTTTLLFSAGPDEESHGLFGTIVAH
jgi:uncharacterized protein (TIGR03118 family)